MIHVAYRLWGGDGHYAKWLGVSMLSMFENTKEKVTVHIMHNERLTPDNRGKFCYIAGQYNQKVEFHNVEEIAGSTLRKFEAAYPSRSGVNASWYPLIIHEVFPNLDKLIFLGTDTVINLDISELWAYDLGEHGFGAVPEDYSGHKYLNRPLMANGYVQWCDYINADVLLLKPKFFLDNFDHILQACKFAYKEGCNLKEQDVLNYLFSTTLLKLPLKFNAIVSGLRRHPISINEAIFHYAGGSTKPNLNTDDIYNKLYFEYFLKTPWATADMFGNIYKTCKRQCDFLKEQALHYTNVVSERGRVFLIRGSDIPASRKLYAIKDNEPIINESDPEALAKFLETTYDLKGKKLIYVTNGDYNRIKNELQKRNLVEGTDFFNARLLLVGGGISNFDPWAVVREM